MAKLIYWLKINVSSDESTTKLPEGTFFSRGKQGKIGRFVQFVVFTYVPLWINSSVSNDLLLLAKPLHSHKQVDESLASAALQAFNRHTWHLSEELVPLCLFSTELKDDIKTSMVSALMQASTDMPSKRFGTGYGKPNLSSVPSNTQQVMN